MWPFFVVDNNHEGSSWGNENEIGMPHPVSFAARHANLVRHERRRATELTDRLDNHVRILLPQPPALNVLETGRIILHDRPSALRVNKRVNSTYLGGGSARRAVAPYQLLSPNPPAGLLDPKPRTASARLRKAAWFA